MPMALTEKTRKRLEVAMARAEEAEELTGVIEAQMDAIADIATADATDLTSAQTLANNNKAKINELLAALRVAGFLAA